MNKCIIIISVIFNSLLTSALSDDVCEKCVHSDNCPQFNNMNRDEQQRWKRQFPCQQRAQNESSSLYGVAPVVREVYVCCISNLIGVNKNDEAVGGTNVGDQCEANASMPPDPDSGCCGLDMSGSEGSTDLQNVVSRRLRSLIYPYMQNNIILKQETENNALGVGLDNRIAGGSETKLNQFPWAVLLEITFDYGNNITTFNCGGSIISPRYILTAAHCVYDEGATLSKIEIYMAEYDKRTFPRDCELSSIGENMCVDNVKMYAENIIHHPEYDDKVLYNDIALIRLRGVAPYTEFVRPICLAPINVDNQAFYELPLSVTGWGRNGSYISDVKQSTVVNLVPHNECQTYYSYLSSSHLCAAGKAGEDTCRGDSGGPLMMLYGGKYYVVGVVSGKRADYPCGSSVPSLYTNVFEYSQWIRNNIK